MTKIPKQLARKNLYQSPWINLYCDQVQLNSGKILESYHIIERPNFVTILLKNFKDQYCFIESLRYPTQSKEIEIPAGSIDANETPLQAAHRELMEETGFKMLNTKILYQYHSYISISNQTGFLIYGELDNKSKPTAFDTDEVSKVFWLSKSEIQTLLKNNQIKDSETLVALNFV